MAFLKRCQNVRVLRFSGAAVSLADDTLEDGSDLDEDDAPVLATCEAELPELWMLAELADELEPPPELPWELALDDAPELELDERCATRLDETNKMETMTRAESRIKHLQPGVDRPVKILVVLLALAFPII